MILDIKSFYFSATEKIEALTYKKELLTTYLNIFKKEIYFGPSDIPLKIISYLLIF